ncbi:MAG: M20 peptidase family dipeptidase, partial [Pseudomonadota bacterium]
MSREAAVAAARGAVPSGAYEAALAALVARLTDGRDPDALRAYLTEEIAPRVEALGAAWEVLENPEPGGPPFLAIERIEGPDRPTVLFYGHGDTVPA